jgi:hypothetical protein
MTIRSGQTKPLNRSLPELGSGSVAICEIIANRQRSRNKSGNSDIYVFY